MDEKCYGPYTSGLNNDTDVCQAKLRTECSPLMSGPAYKLACEEDIQRDILNSVVLIGWGNDKGIPFWLAMNSWGPEWGVGGYLKILHG